MMDETTPTCFAGKTLCGATLKIGNVDPIPIPVIVEYIIISGIPASLLRRPRKSIPKKAMKIPVAPIGLYRLNFEIRIPEALLEMIIETIIGIIIRPECVALAPRTL